MNCITAAATDDDCVGTKWVKSAFLEYLHLNFLPDGSSLHHLSRSFFLPLSSSPQSLKD